jgi:hypothetical protein
VDYYQSIRWGWLKGVYIATIVVAGGFGLGIIFLPNTTGRLLENSCAPATFGIVGSVFLAFALLSVLGLRNPLKLVPILLLQLAYKSIWLFGVALPLAIQHRLPDGEILTVVLFALIAAADLVAIPFKYVFSRDTFPSKKG